MRAWDRLDDVVRAEKRLLGQVGCYLPRTGSRRRVHAFSGGGLGAEPPARERSDRWSNGVNRCSRRLRSHGVARSSRWVSGVARSAAPEIRFLPGKGCRRAKILELGARTQTASGWRGRVRPGGARRATQWPWRATVGCAGPGGTAARGLRCAEPGRAARQSGTRDAGQRPIAARLVSLVTPAESRRPFPVWLRLAAIGLPGRGCCRPAKILANGGAAGTPGGSGKTEARPSGAGPASRSEAGPFGCGREAALSLRGGKCCRRAKLSQAQRLRRVRDALWMARTAAMRRRPESVTW